ncbi:MAG: hypothetical protein AAGI53_03545 [Planctomycetota bacterium]
MAAHSIDVRIVTLVFAVVCGSWLAGCGGATQTRLYEVGPTLRDRAYDRVHIRHAATDDGVAPETRAAFEAELADELIERDFEVSDSPGGALEIVYRAVSYNAGSTSARIATAIAGSVSPVGVFGEVGSGEVAIKVDFFDPDGSRVADTVVQQQISGATSHVELTVRALAGTVAKFAAARFGAGVAEPLRPDEEWTGGLPLYRALEGEWRFTAQSAAGETLATGELDIDLHHNGRVVISSARVDDVEEQPADAVSALFQLRTGRVIRWWLDPSSGEWRETPIRLAARSDGFVYRSETGDVTMEGYVRAERGAPTAQISVSRIEGRSAPRVVEVMLERR